MDPATSPVNANGSLLVARADGGAWLLADARTGAERALALPDEAREVRWSPLDANSAYYLVGNALYRYDVRRAESTRLGEYALYERIGSGGRGDVVLLPDGHIKLALLGERPSGAQDLLLLSIRERATFGRETVSSTSWRLDTPATGAMLTPLGRAVALGEPSRAFAADGTLVATLDAPPLDFCLVGGEDSFLARHGSGISVAPLLGGTSRALGPGERASCRGVHAEGVALVEGAGEISVAALEREEARWRLGWGAVEDAAPSRDMLAAFYTSGGSLFRVDAEGDVAAAIASRVRGS